MAGERRAESTGRNENAPRVRGVGEAGLLTVGTGSSGQESVAPRARVYLQAALRAATLSVFSQVKVLNFFLP